MPRAPVAAPGGDARVSPATVARLGGVLIGAMAGGCASPELCASPPTEEVAAMCAIDRAREAGDAGDREKALAACEPVADGKWHDECVFRVAERLALRDDLAGALDTCGDATRFARMCIGHVVWLRSEALVDAGPGDGDAQGKVDALVGGLPTGKAMAESVRARWSVATVARAAAWHGIYAGSGSADPTAARAASVEDAPYARGAFAWEATRLLGAATEPGRLVDEVRAVWRGEAAPPNGAPLPEPCWTGRQMPRLDTALPGAVTARVWSSGTRFIAGERFVAADPEVDLRIATLDARWSAGQDPDAATIRALLADPSPEVRRTAARYAALDTAAFPDLTSLGTTGTPAAPAPPGTPAVQPDPELPAFAEAVRRSAEDAARQDPSPAPRDARCPG